MICPLPLSPSTFFYHPLRSLSPSDPLSIYASFGRLSSTLTLSVPSPRLPPVDLTVAEDRPAYPPASCLQRIDQPTLPLP
eukprot:3650523-Pleurochrysis_carterae.AAC.1